MPSNGSRHNDEALGSAGDPRDPRAGRREGEPLSPDRGRPDQIRDDQGGPRVRDLRASRDISDFSDMADVVEGDIVDAEIADSEIVGVGGIESLVVERDELLDTLKRTLADFDNYRKRVERQSAELRDRANERMVEALLPALDAFSLARAHLGDAQGTPEVRALLQAASTFEHALQKEGLSRIEAEGAAFDPVSHDAVEHVEADDSETGEVAPGGAVVTDVLRPGYLWKGR